MANIKKLGMAAAISADKRVTISKAFFGLATKAVYNPTNSPIEAFQNDYSSENGEKLKAVLACPADKLEQLTKKYGTIEKAPMGPARLEGCLSADHQFAALQLLGYSDFEYLPLSDIRFYEGWEAELISTLI